MGRKASLEVILDCSDPQTLMGFWRDALGYRVHYSDRSLALLVPTDGNAVALILQRVPEPKSGKNRMHIDVIAEDVEGEITRLGALGARRLHDGVQSFVPVQWVVMADPENNEFCVSTGSEW